MTIRLIVVGKTDIAYLQQGIDEYVKRLTHYVRFEMVVIPAQKAATPAQMKQQEAKMLLPHLQNADRIVLLDEHGRQYTSTLFAQHLQQLMNSGLRSLVFVVGGPYGFDQSIRNIAHEQMALSTMTMTHQMVRLLFVEQLYRAMTILHGEKYHNE